VKIRILLTAFLLQAAVLFSAENSCNERNTNPTLAVPTTVDYFMIVKTGSKYTQEFLQTSLRKANFCGSFYQNKRNEIVFDDGSIIQLKSKAEIIEEGGELNQTCVLNDSVEYHSYVWSISDEGLIMKGHPHAIQKNQIIKN